MGGWTTDAPREPDPPELRLSSVQLDPVQTQTSQSGFFSCISLHLPDKHAKKTQTVKSRSREKKQTCPGGDEKATL